MNVDRDEDREHRQLSIFVNKVTSFRPAANDENLSSGKLLVIIMQRRFTESERILEMCTQNIYMYLYPHCKNNDKKMSTNLHNIDGSLEIRQTNRASEQKA